MKKLIIILGVVILLGIIIVPRIMQNSNETTETMPQVITVEAQAVKRDTLTTKVELLGTVSSDQTVAVIATVPAKVKSVNVKVGDAVNEGDLLFVLDPSDVEDQVALAEIGLTSSSATLEQAELGLTNAQQSVEQAQIAYDMAKANYEMQLEQYEYAVDNLEKYEILYNEGIVSKSEYEQLKMQASPETLTVLEKQLQQAEQGIAQANLGVENARSTIKQANAGYAQAQQNYQTATEALEDMTFEAPIDGFISQVNISEEQYASSSQASIVIDAMNTIKVSTNVTENLVNKIVKGQEALVEITALEGEMVVGVVDTLSPVSDARTLLYPMTIVVDNEDHKIKPGMFATLEFETEKKENVLSIPKDALIYRGDTYYVYVVKEETQVELREVEIGLDAGATIEIISGLDQGELIVTNGIGLLDETSIISVIRGDE